jgi:purine-nucleoside phosphorylase
MSTSLSARLHDAVSAIRAMAAKSDSAAKAADWRPELGIILGSGLGDLANEVEAAIRIPYAEIPHFPVSTVHGHSGTLVLGRLEGRNVMCYQGRVHFYEGYSMDEITFSVRLMEALGAHTMLVTNAVGGISEFLIPGDLVAIRDHINFMGTNPLRGPNDENIGPRFPRMDDAYDVDLRAYALDTAKRLGVDLKSGVYLALTGPSYETRAEINFFRQIGADTVGMSTVPEVIVARHSGLRVLGVSCVTNALHGSYEEADHAAVVAQAKETGPRFVKLIRGIVNRLPAPQAAPAPH